MTVTPFPSAGVDLAVGPNLHLFDGPFVTIDGRRHAIPDCCERLMVLLTLRRTWVARSVAAGVLWPLADDRRAAGNLRSALWRLRGAGLELVDTTTSSLTLHADVTVDAHVASDWAQRIIGGQHRDDDLRVVPWFAAATSLLSNWSDDWAILERERLRHRTLHAFEQLSVLLIEADRVADAVKSARTLVAADPLRESAQRALIMTLLAAHDPAGAMRVAETYRELHRRVFGVDPSSRLRELVARCADPLAARPR